MFNSSLRLKEILLNVSVITAIVLAAVIGVNCQTQDPAERQRALDVYESQNMVAALPLLERVALAYPNDLVVLSRLGFALYANAVDEKDAATKQKMRSRAYTILVKSQSLGDNSPLTKMTVGALA